MKQPFVVTLLVVYTPEGKLNVSMNLTDSNPTEKISETEIITALSHVLKAYADQEKERMRKKIIHRGGNGIIKPGLA